MTSKTNNDTPQLVLDMATTSFLGKVLAYEQAGVDREAILSLVKPQIEEIDKGRKAIKNTILDQMKSLGAVDSVKVVNVLCLSRRGAEQAERSRLSRRRNFFKSLCTSRFPDYDFELDAGMLHADYIGSATIREANILLSGLQKLLSMDLFPFADDIESVTREDIVKGLESLEAQPHEVEALVVGKSAVEAMGTILARVEKVHSKLTGNTAEQAQSEQAQSEQQA